VKGIMIGRVAALLYGVLSYLVFVCSIVYAMGFIGNFVVPRSIDIGVSASLAESILVDVLLLGAFAVPHSIMARPAFKRWWTTIVPSHCERSSYVLQSSLLLLVIFWQWRPITMTIWRADGAPATVLISIYWIGWVIALSSTFQIDHFDLFGLRQVFAALRGAVHAAPVFKTPLLYRLVRHPLMSGLLLVFWATPLMSAGHLLFAALSTGYILVGLQLEENDLMVEFGDRYRQYRQRVPMLFPRLLRR
jgi:protein-S-isoprenylcysteine O-methyltransferase Ste14